MPPYQERQGSANEGGAESSVSNVQEPANVAGGSAQVQEPVVQEPDVEMAQDESSGAKTGKFNKRFDNYGHDLIN